MFRSWTLENQVAYLKDRQTCLYCLRHNFKNDCFAKAKPDYKGCGTCGGHHRTEYHFAGIAVNRLFQLHVRPVNREEGTEVFELRQDLWTEEGNFTIAFDGGSDATLVTEAYAAKWKCKRLDRQAAYVGFGQRVPKMGDVYEVVVADRLGKPVRLEAIAVPLIYSGPAATCRIGTNRKFWESAPPLDGLCQSGRPTDICVGADYWQLQPRFLENEWGGGPLNIYRSAFGCGFILRGELPPPPPVAARRQEVPEVQESGGHPAAAEESGGHAVTADQE
jgi:hypothetical protein